MNVRVRVIQQPQVYVNSCQNLVYKFFRQNNHIISSISRYLFTGVASAICRLIIEDYNYDCITHVMKEWIFHWGTNLNGVACEVVVSRDRGRHASMSHFASESSWSEAESSLLPVSYLPPFLRPMTEVYWGWEYHFLCQKENPWQ